MWGKFQNFQLSIQVNLACLYFIQLHKNPTPLGNKSERENTRENFVTLQISAFVAKCCFLSSTLHIIKMYENSFPSPEVCLITYWMKFNMHETKPAAIYYCATGHSLTDCPSDATCVWWNLTDSSWTWDYFVCSCWLLIRHGHQMTLCRASLSASELCSLTFLSTKIWLFWRPGKFKKLVIQNRTMLYTQSDQSALYLERVK